MCNCATGTHWDNGSCVSDRASCSVGWVYYTDGTCSVPAAYTTSKTVLGIVVYVNPDVDVPLGISLGMKVSQIREAIKNNPDG